jgi:hypothetical protein
MIALIMATSSSNLQSKIIQSDVIYVSRSNGKLRQMLRIPVIVIHTLEFSIVDQIGIIQILSSSMKFQWAMSFDVANACVTPESHAEGERDVRSSDLSLDVSIATTNPD